MLNAVQLTEEFVFSANMLPDEGQQLIETTGVGPIVVAAKLAVAFGIPFEGLMSMFAGQMMLGGTALVTVIVKLHDADLPA